MKTKKLKLDQLTISSFVTTAMTEENVIQEGRTLSKIIQCATDELTIA